jgi:HlyD family secretion protein
VRVYVPETKLGKVRLNQQAKLTMDACPDRVFTGTVFQIASEAEFTPRNVQSVEERRYQVFGVKVRVDDTEGLFKAGMAAQVTFEFESARERTP